MTVLHHVLGLRENERCHVFVCFVFLRVIVNKAIIFVLSFARWKLTDLRQQFLRSGGGAHWHRHSEGEEAPL